MKCASMALHGSAGPYGAGLASAGLALKCWARTRFGVLPSGTHWSLFPGIRAATGVGFLISAARMHNAGRAMSCRMSTPKTNTLAAFTPGERNTTRRDLDQFFSTMPSVADGFQLRTWRGGAQARQPKVPLVA